MQNRGMERSAGYAGILGALIFIAVGVIPMPYPPASASAAAIAAYGSSHVVSTTISDWLTFPAVAFIIWFGVGLFDYLRKSTDRDWTLSQWGGTGLVVWGAILLIDSALQQALVMRNPGGVATLPALYALVTLLLVFAMGSFGAFAFAVAHESHRKSALPQWLNAFGYLVFAVDLLYTISIFSRFGHTGVDGYGSFVAPLLSAIWIIMTSAVLLTSLQKAQKT
ncbi:MAG: hypothetical protein ACREMP_00255 [Candidatus Tyrphobacter sp.]